MKKVINKDPTVFALSTDTLAIKKIPRDSEGNTINPDFNSKTYIKKAYKAYLKGLYFFKYKGYSYPVPRIKKSKLEEILNEEIKEVSNE